MQINVPCSRYSEIVDERLLGTSPWIRIIVNKPYSEGESVSFIDPFAQISPRVATNSSFISIDSAT